jgi:hypothetical protein
MRFEYYDDHETVEDIREEYRRDHRRGKTLPGTLNKVRFMRESMAREREKHLQQLEFEDQMESQPFALNINLRNKYQIERAIKFLQTAYDATGDEVVRVPDIF